MVFDQRGIEDGDNSVDIAIWSKLLKLNFEKYKEHGRPTMNVLIDCSLQIEL